MQITLSCFFYYEMKNWPFVFWWALWNRNGTLMKRLPCCLSLVLNEEFCKCWSLRHLAIQFSVNKKAQKQQGFGENSSALQSQQRFGEAENSFSRDPKERVCLPAMVRAPARTQQWAAWGWLYYYWTVVVTSAAPQLGWDSSMPWLPI